MNVENTIADRDLKVLEAAISGQVSVRGQAGYDQARQAWNLAVDERPYVVVVAESASDVVQAVRYARAHGMRVAPQGTGHGAAPLDGIARGGYKLAYSDTPSDYFKKMEARRKITDLTFSLGLVIGRESKLTDVLWGGPAHTAGLTVGTQIVAVDGLAYDSDRLKELVKAAKTNNAPIELLIKNGDRYSTVHIDYHDGLRYPLLLRDASVPARLDQILSPRS